MAAIPDSEATREQVCAWLLSPPPTAAVLRFDRFPRAMPSNLVAGALGFVAHEILGGESDNDDKRLPGCHITWYAANGHALGSVEVFPLESTQRFEAAIFPTVFGALRDQLAAQGRGLEIQISVAQEYLLDRGHRVVERWPMQAPFRSEESLEKPSQRNFLAQPASAQHTDLLRTAGAKVIMNDTGDAPKEIVTDQSTPIILRLLVVGFVVLMAIGFWWLIIPGLLIPRFRSFVGGVLRTIVEKSEAYHYQFDPQGLWVRETGGRDPNDQRVA